MTPVHHGAALPSSDGEGRAVRMSGVGFGFGGPVGREDSGAAVRTGHGTAGREGRGAAGREGRDTRILTDRLSLAPVTAADEAELFALHSDPRAFVEDSTDPLTDPVQTAWVLGRWRESWSRHGIGHLTVRAREGTDLPVGLLGVVGLVPLADGAEPAESAEPETEADPAGDARPADDVRPADDARPTGHGASRTAGGPSTGREDDGATTGPAAQVVLSAYWRLRPEVTGLGVATESMRAVLEALPAMFPRVASAPSDGTAPHEVVAITASGNMPSRALASRLGFRPAPSERPVPGGRADDVLLLLETSARA